MTDRTRPVRRVGSVIGLQPGAAEQYETYHAEVWPGVLKTLADCHIGNYSIYRFGDLLFSYFEYSGEDYESDLARMADDPVTRRWWSVVNPLQAPVEGLGAGEWLTLPEVFHLE